MKSKVLISLVFGLAVGTSSAADSPANKWNYEEAQTGALPAGWVAAKTGTGPGSVWQVRADGSALHRRTVRGQLFGGNPGVARRAPHPRHAW